MTRPDYELFDRKTTAIINGYHRRPIQRMLDFDYICQRQKPSVASIVNPAGAGLHKAFFGTEEILIPIYASVAEAASEHPEADVMINFASSRSAFPSTMEALDQPTIRTIAVIAEGVPERKARIIAAVAREREKTIIGPATVGGIAPGCFRVGNTGGTIDNIVSAKLNRRGTVGFVAKSGGMSNESFNSIARHTNGIYEGIPIGGDAYPGSTLLDHLLRFEANPEIKMMVCLGEIGGSGEYRIVEALEDGRITKPLVAWAMGTCAKEFPTNLQFGHAGAKASTEKETADAKNAALRQAGAVVPDSYDDFGDRIRETFKSLEAAGEIEPIVEPEVPELPMDYEVAKRQGMVRKSTHFICTISDDRGEEPTYNQIPISQVLESDMGIGGVISLLWFKKDLPEYAREFIEMCLQIVADHGPAVSGAHNAIIATRAGKDLISSLVSGLLTIGPRFGGAINDAAHYFKQAFDAGQKPREFVADMKAKGIYIPGIGHRVRSVGNPDVRVTLLKDYAREHFPSNDLLDFALEVEKVTTAKKGNLILNVDGCIGVCFVDMLRGSGCFTEEAVQEIIDLGYLNAIFVLGRSIGFMGHVLDQKRLKQPLYRHPWDDISYL